MGINGTSTSTVSADSNTLTFIFSDSSANNSDPVTGKGESTRVAKGPAGAHLISGSWRTTKMDNLSENGLLVTFKVEGDPDHELAHRAGIHGEAGWNGRPV